MSNMCARSCLFLVALTSFVVTPAALTRVAAAQSMGTLAGKVTGETGLALTGADVAVDGTQLRTTTDERGEFRLSGLPAGRVGIKARRLGFRPDSAKVLMPESGTETVNLTLSIATQELKPVLVHGDRVRYSGRLAGYYERLERRSAGVFVTRAQIEKENAHNLTQLLQRVPGISLQRVAGGAMGIRMRDRTCWPLVWLDGNALPSGETDLDGIQPNSLEGVELYLGSTTAPARYTWTRNLASCGTILLWSRSGESDRPRPEVSSLPGLDSLIASLAVFTADQVDVTATLDSAKPLAIPYPPSLYAAHTRGVVLAEFVVDPEGRVEEGTLGIVASSHPLFAEAVRQALAGAVFTPALRGGKAVRQLVHQPFEFEGIK
jgi:TonB family protein